MQFSCEQGYSLQVKASFSAEVHLSWMHRLKGTTPTFLTYHTHHRFGVTSFWSLGLNHLRLICMSDLMLFNSSTNHTSSFIYSVNPSGFSAKHTALLGFVQLLNNILRCCDQSNRNTAHSPERFLFFPSLCSTYSE